MTVTGTILHEIQRNFPGTAPHINVVNPGEDVEPAISHLRSLASDVALSATFEFVDFADKLIGFRRTYYASIRFLRAYQFLCVSPSACFILDADCIVRGSLLDLRHVSRDHDVLLHQRMQESIYLSLASGGVFIGNKQAARLYLKDAAEKSSACSRREPLLGSSTRWRLALPSRSPSPPACASGSCRAPI